MPIHGSPIRPRVDEAKLAELVRDYTQRFGTQRAAALLQISPYAVLSLASGRPCRLGTLAAARANAHLLEGAGVSFESRGR
jgi:hypothetical protein